jgi:uncharacterized protein
MLRPIILPEIQAEWFSPKLKDLGQVVTDADDINQCITIILSTPKGSDCHRPEFGSDLHLYIDYPTNLAAPHLVRESFEAIAQWEPRVNVESVEVFLNEPEIQQVRLVVVWSLKDSDISSTAEVIL